jgi:hypothetical protein
VPASSSPAAASLSLWRPRSSSPTPAPSSTRPHLQQGRRSARLPLPMFSHPPLPLPADLHRRSSWASAVLEQGGGWARQRHATVAEHPAPCTDGNGTTVLHGGEEDGEPGWICGGRRQSSFAGARHSSSSSGSHGSRAGGFGQSRGEQGRSGPCLRAAR